MNKEMIIDALEYIDLDIIEETNALRLKERRAVKRMPRIKWKQIALVAAAVCLIIVGINALRPIGGKKDAMSDGFKEDGAGDIAMENDAMLSESGDMIIRIDEWRDDGFIGTVINKGSSGYELEGSSVEVQFFSETVIDVKGYKTFFYKDNNAKECGIPVGTVLTVAYGDLARNHTSDSESVTTDMSGVTGSAGNLGESYTMRAYIILEEAAFYE